jgi:hypothetical protein
MAYHLTLEDEPTPLAVLPRINRSTFHRYRRLSDYEDMLTFRKWRTGQQRFVELALDEFAGLPAADQEQRLSALLARLELLRVNAVIVQPFTRDGRGAFFQNPRIPLVTDFLNRVLHQIRTRLRVDHVYLRITPTQTSATTEVYKELSRLNRFTGVMFDTEPAPEIAALMRRHQPQLRILVLARGSSVPAGHLWSEISADDSMQAIETRAREVSGLDRNAMILLRRPLALEDDRLMAAMQALRRAGVRHYGYDNDEYLRNRPALARVGPELQAFVAGNGGDR